MRYNFLHPCAPPHAASALSIVFVPACQTALDRHWTQHQALAWTTLLHIVTLKQPSIVLFLHRSNSSWQRVTPACASVLINTSVYSVHNGGCGFYITGKAVKVTSMLQVTRPFANGAEHLRWNTSLPLSLSPSLTARQWSRAVLVWSPH